MPFDFKISSGRRSDQLLAGCSGNEIERGTLALIPPSARAATEILPWLRVSPSPASPASQRWAALPGGTAGPPCSRVGARGPCGHQPFLQVLWGGGEVVLGAYLTRWEGRDPFQWGSASGDVPWCCARCLQLPTPGITGCGSQRPRCFPVRPWRLPQQEIIDEPALIKGKRPFCWDYSLPLKLGTELSPLEAAQHRTPAQRSLAPGRRQLFPVPRCQHPPGARGRHPPARFLPPAQTRRWGVPPCLLSGDIPQTPLGRAMLCLHHRQQHPWLQSNLTRLIRRPGQVMSAKQFSL